MHVCVRERGRGGRDMVLGEYQGEVGGKRNGDQNIV